MGGTGEGVFVKVSVDLEIRTLLRRARTYVGTVETHGFVVASADHGSTEYYLYYVVPVLRCNRHSIDAQ